jgi:hypothetical protein
MNPTPYQGEALRVEGATTLKGKLDLSGNLSLYDPTNTMTPLIAFDISDTANPKILFNGQEVLSQNGGMSGGGGTFTSGGNGNLLIGQNASGGSYNSIAIGTNANSYDHATAIGYYANANNTGAVALGNFVNASAYDAIAIGRDSSASNYGAIALGNSVNASSENSVTIGHNLQTSSYTSGQIVLGTYNEVRDAAAFIIANGTGNYEYNPATGNYGENRGNLFLITTAGKGIFRHTSFSEPSIPVPEQEKEALRVKGDASIEGNVKVTGALLLQPASDLDMGPFTTTANP